MLADKLRAALGPAKQSGEPANASQRDRPAGSAVAEKAAAGGSSAGDGGNAPRPGQSSNTGHTDAKEES